MQQLPQPGLRTKYTKEARGLFGVMIYDDDEGNTHGDRMQPLNYTNQKVVGPVTYTKTFWAEVHRVNTLKTTGTNK